MASCHLYKGELRTMSLSEIVQRGWDAVGAGDFDALVADYVEDMTFVMPGQADVLEGRSAFRAALDGLGKKVSLERKGSYGFKKMLYADF